MLRDVGPHILLQSREFFAVILNNIFLGVQSLYRRCPNLQGMETRLSR